MTELQFLARLRKAAPRIGDDCAVIPNGKTDLLFTTDLLIEDVHFRRNHKPVLVGAKAILRALSDIAAMGGTPRYCLLSVAAPGWSHRQWLDRFYKGALDTLQEHRTELIGGDLSSSAAFTCDVLLCGDVPKGTALLRSGARPGDHIYVSGALGSAAARNFRIPPLPHPRLALGRKLRGRATACMDLSDGLSLDLHRLSLESGTSAHLDHIPIAPKATLDQALHGGEDYELLATSAKRLRIPGLIRIGQMRDGPPGAVYLQKRPIEPKGFDHFSKS